MAETTMKNIDLAIRSKEKFTINGNENDVIELNTADVGITARYAKVIPRINGIPTFQVRNEEDVDNLDLDLDTDPTGEKFSSEWDRINNEIKDVINFVYDYDVCSVCAKSGSMFDLMGGQFRFEVIMETLFNLYDTTITDETKKLSKRIQKHTDKYMPQDHKRK